MKLNIDNLTEAQAAQLTGYLKVVMDNAIVTTDSTPGVDLPNKVGDNEEFQKATDAFTGHYDLNPKQKDAMFSACYEGNIKDAAQIISSDVGIGIGDATVLAIITFTHLKVQAQHVATKAMRAQVKNSTLINQIETTAQQAAAQQAAQTQPVAQQPPSDPVDDAFKALGG